MRIFKLLTYSIREHNYIIYSSFKPKNERKSFWSLLWKEVSMALGRKGLSFISRQIRHPYYQQIKKLNEVVFTPLSSNNQRALEPIWLQLVDNEYSILWAEDDMYIPKRYVRFWSLVFIWPLLKLYICSNRDDKLRIRTYFDEFFNTIGYIVTLRRLFKYNHVKMVVMANDHCSYTRALIYVAKELSIKTMYVQHCSVTERFPSLPFTYSMLDGEESLDKYLSIGPSEGSIYVLGNPRFDIISKYQKKKEVLDKIGIASNALDNELMIRKLCVRLQDEGFKDITIRPHPGVPFDASWYLDRGIEYSDSNKENPFAFLSRMGCVIAGECGIHFDAAMMGVKSICYNMAGQETKLIDWYSYIKNGLIPYVANFDELMAWLKNLRLNNNNQSEIQWYNAAYGTQFEGHIGEMLADFICYERAGNIDGFDKKYGFVERMHSGELVKKYNV